jgi:acyl-CoA reductase-like NAD-dependent aldehyde dehydrogenase
MAESRLPDGVAIQHPESLYIDGRWVAPARGGRIEVIDPNTEELAARVAEATEPDMDAAVAAARKAFDTGPWPQLPVAERARYLRAMSAHLHSRKDELINAYIAQTGALLAMANGMIPMASETLADFARIGEQFDWISKPSTGYPNSVALVIREPVGVVAAIAPWNAPYAIMTQKIAPALISGCTVIMKPAPETPLEAYILAEAAEVAGLPPGVLNLVPSHREAADHLVRSPGVDKISFTGSTAAGRRIASVAGERIARVTLELGGKSPAVVLDDYPVAAAAPLLARTITVMTGQVCAMLSRAIVPAHRYEEYAEAIAAEMRRVKIGPSRDPTSEMGPLAMKRQLERVEGYIRTGLEQGARLVCGGRRPAHLKRGFFIEPTLFADVAPDARIAQEEIFGPVLCLFAARDTDEAIRLANDTMYGLNAAVLTNDANEAFRLARRIRSGNLGQNGMKADFNLPFGGCKQSGVGREGGVEGLSAYLETKTLLLDRLPEALA